MAGGIKVAVWSAVGPGPWCWGTGGGGVPWLLLVLFGCVVCGSGTSRAAAAWRAGARAFFWEKEVLFPRARPRYSAGCRGRCFGGRGSSRLTRESQVDMNSSQQFCYKNVLIPKWYDIWTRIQVRVNSSKLVRVTQVDNEEKLKELEQFSIWNFFSSFLKEKLNDTYVNVGLYSTKTCLKVEIIEKDTKYSVIVTRSFLLFHWSERGNCGLPANRHFYALQVYAQGYVFTVGFMSFAVCYKYGPLENDRSINLLTWALQLLGLGFMYSSIQIPHVAFALIIIALCTKNLEYPIHWLYITY
ncbi:hypothetical protein A6R68_01378, partial [Neotoma lepida]